MPFPHWCEPIFWFGLSFVPVKSTVHHPSTLAVVGVTQQHPVALTEYPQQVHRVTALSMLVSKVRNKASNITLGDEPSSSTLWWSMLLSFQEENVCSSCTWRVRIGSWGGRRPKVYVVLLPYVNDYRLHLRPTCDCVTFSHQYTLKFANIITIIYHVVIGPLLLISSIIVCE